MAKKRAEARDLQIPLPKDIGRRLACLGDAELFLRTYFAEVFTEPFTPSRREQIRAVIDAAMYGGDQSIADARGEGKTSTAMHVALYLMVKGLSTFPLVIGKAQKKAEMELMAIRESLQLEGAFAEDFPEIAAPFKAVGGWSSRARMQTVGGINTNIKLAADHIIFPTISREQLPNWPSEVEPASCGQIMASMGVDGPIRGTKVRNKRPTIAIIDDMEDRLAATSDTLIEKNEEILEQDIAGLGASAERISRVMLCTIQNRKCIAFKYTDPKQKPSWRGKRFRKMLRPPERMDLVEQYIAMRRERKSNDPDAREAFRFWRDNRTEIERGAEISNPYSYSKKMHVDGEPLELSAIQAYYNRVADVGPKAVATEIDNDPPEDIGPQGSGLTAEIVASRISGLARYQLPANATALTAAIDLGKHRCHWVVVAWWKGAGGCVVDYGVVEVVGNQSVHLENKADDMLASEPAIYRALLNWRDELLAKEYVDATGTRRRVDLAFVDSGSYTNAAYEFVRQVQGIFKPSKGVAPYHRRAKNTETTRAGSNQHAEWQPAQKVWLYHLDSNYWKQWVHERFLTPTFDEENMLRRGSLSVFTPEKDERHSSYSHHIVSEELQTEFVEGKGTVEKWFKKNENNHWLDATYMAAACTESVGIGLITPSEATVVATKKEAKPKTSPKPHGRFRTRPGGWVNGARRR